MKHMTATKAWLSMVIRQYGPEVLGDEWKARSLEDAIAALDEAPREVIPPSSCANQDETGHCLGHPEKE